MLVYKHRPLPFHPNVNDKSQRLGPINAKPKQKQLQQQQYESTTFPGYNQTDKTKLLTILLTYLQLFTHIHIHTNVLLYDINLEYDTECNIT